VAVVVGPVAQVAVTVGVVVDSLSLAFALDCEPVVPASVLVADVS